jgi:hypothetical protein
MMIRAETDLSGLSAMVRDMRRLTGASYESVVKETARGVLRLAANYTPTAKPAEEKRKAEAIVKRRYNTYGGGAVGKEAKGVYPRISRTKTGGKAWWITGPGKYHEMLGPWRWPDAMWADYTAEENDRIQDLAVTLKDYPAARVRAIGITKQSWLQIGDALGISPLGCTGEAKARAAISAKRGGWPTSTGTETESGPLYFVELINRMPLLVDGSGKMDGSAILQRAIRAREKAFEIELQKGVFDSMDAISKRYPGLATVTP